MKRFVGCAIIVALFVGACNNAKPTLVGRLYGPTDLAEFKGCPQNFAGCDKSTQAHHLLLIADSLNNDLRIFDVELPNFFVAADPLFPLSIPVGELPVSLAIDPRGEFAFVVNAISQNVSLVDLAGDHLVEVDTDADIKTCAPELQSDPPNDRCLAGVTRVVLQPDLHTNVQPEFIVAPRHMAGASDTDPWPIQTPLPVYVSLLETGKIAVLNFHYPDSTGNPQRFDPQPQLLNVGGSPSGLALTKNGMKLFVANEGSNSIQMIDIGNNNAMTPIDVGGPSRRLALTPDETRLYVVHSKTAGISVVDVATGNLCAPCNASCNGTTPDNAIQLAGIPRSVTFVDGLTLSVNGQNYTSSSDGHEVTLFAYVSNLDGSVYVVDAENHCSINASTTPSDSFLYEMFVPTTMAGMAGELISDNFGSNGTNDYRIYLLFEGSDALMEFFPADLSSTNYLLYQ